MKRSTTLQCSVATIAVAGTIFNAYAADVNGVSSRVE